MTTTLNEGETRTTSPPEKKDKETSPGSSLHTLGWPLTFGLAAIVNMLCFNATVSILENYRNPRTPAIALTTRPDFLPCGADSLLSSVPVLGLHLVCLEDTSENNYGVRIYRNSHKGKAPVTTYLKKTSDGDVLAGLRLALEEQLRLNRTNNPSWDLFTRTGDRITSTKILLSASTALLYEGGAFIWPGVDIGHKERIAIGSDVVVMETLSLRPLVFSIDNFLTVDECDYIQNNAAPHMKSSGVSLMDKDKGKEATNWRTSKTYFMASKGHSVLQAIDDRVAHLTRVPKSHQELVQVLRYGEHEKYDAHHDYFDPRLYSKDARTLSMTSNGKVNRMATVLWYLSDIDGGGETIFPQFGGLTPPRRNDQCDIGLKVKPKKGKVIMFYSLTPDGHGDKNSLHGSCPVEGIKNKWAANKWVWSAPMSTHFETP